MARTLTEALRGLDAAQLTALLATRPDLTDPPPSDLGDLAARASTGASVGLLQGNHVGPDFLQHAQNAVGIAAAVEAHRLAHVVGGKGEGGGAHRALPLFH